MLRQTLVAALSIVLLAASLTPAVAKKLLVPSGAWTGVFFYPQGDNRKPVSFVATLEAVQDSFSGKIVEPRTFGSGSSEFLYSTVIGRANANGKFIFMKRYDGTGGVNHTVYYEGRYNKAKGRVTGKWYIDKFSGQFQLTAPGY